ncbi:hypothetical protein [Hydrogenovibrio halophilus]|uniref:hypothetical protein n=1 Tax=Hydrogenovibrio halophilus TaxID=373391 RepID=UPI0003653B2A|nr:hypothetical protein [Hydrogenovibrio halophilus]
MQLTYEKPGKDHPMFGRVDFIVADGTTPLCYKVGDHYLPLETSAGSTSAAQDSAKAAESVKTRDLFVLSFKINDEDEEMTFTSKKKLDKARDALSAKPFVSDFDVKTYRVLAE